MKRFLILSLLLSAAVFGFMGCKSESESSNLYEHVRSPSKLYLYKVQIFCPGKTYNYLTTDDYVIDSSHRTDFEDYSTSFKIKSSCPTIVLPIVRKTEDDKVTKEQMEKIYLDGQNIPIIGEDKSLETSSKLPQSIIINNNNVQK